MFPLVQLPGGGTCEEEDSFLNFTYPVQEENLRAITLAPSGVLYSQIKVKNTGIYHVQCLLLSPFCTICLLQEDLIQS